MRTLSRRRSTLMMVGLLASLSLLTAAPVFAQEVPGGEALLPLFWAIMLIAIVPAYVYWALATQVIARKTNTEKGLLAWIPVANYILWANIAKRPFWWGLLCILLPVGMAFMSLLMTSPENGWVARIPIANFTVWVIIAKKPIWWELLCIVPLAGMVFETLLWMDIAEARHKPSWWGIVSIIPVVNLIVPGYLAWSD